jgi:hypothetical protein
MSTSISSGFHISGDIMSLVNGHEPVTAISSPWMFYSLFWTSLGKGQLYSSKHLQLPAVELCTGCYMSMFMNQWSMSSTLSALPATALAPSCYNNMFNACGINRAPMLPATALAPNCYSYMF